MLMCGKETSAKCLVKKIDKKMALIYYITIVI